MKHTKMEPLKGEHYLYKDNIFRIKNISRGTNQIEMIRLSDNLIISTRYDTFKYGFQRVWKIGEVAKFLNRTPRSLYRYEARGQIEKAKRYTAMGKGELRFYTKDDVMEIHELISGIPQGRPRKDRRTVNNTLPERSALLRMFRERYGV